MDMKLNLPFNRKPKDAQNLLMAWRANCTSLVVYLNHELLTLEEDENLGYQLVTRMHLGNMLPGNAFCNFRTHLLDVHYSSTLGVYFLQQTNHYM